MGRSKEMSWVPFWAMIGLNISYESYASAGFTRPQAGIRARTGCDWLSVAMGIFTADIWR
jgi:hypothetical protein